MMNDSLCRIIAGELQARAEQVEAAVRLLDEGNTVPFIARYRKEVTGGLDDTQLRNLETRLGVSARTGRPPSGDPQIHRLNRASSPKRWKKPSTPPSAKPSSKISTCPTSRSAAPAGKSPSKPGSNRWPTCCGMSLPTIRKPKRQTISMPIKAWRIAKPLSTARAIS